MRIVVNVLAVVGALAIVAVVVVAVWFWQVSSPAGEVLPPTASPSAPPTAEAPEAPVQVGEGEVWAAGTQVDAARLLTNAGEVRDVAVTTSGLTAGQGAARAGSVRARATVPFATVERQVGNGVRLSHAGEGRVRASAPITVLGRTLPVSGVGQVRADGDHIVVVPESFDLPGPDVLEDAAGELARRAITVREPVPGLPEGLNLTGVAVRDDGFHADLAGTEVTLAPR